ncbi:PepSY domain-containing protein [Bacillus pretiosus]|uniref:PepSY domain-containing protein n=1 Tax=Bacillus TaxID=1386 RepID=UPI0030C94C71
MKACFGQVIPNLENKNIPSTASISEDEAVNIGKAGIEKEIGKVDNYDGMKKDLYVYEKDGQYYLSYLVKASVSKPAPGYWHYFIDATNGNVIKNFKMPGAVMPDFENRMAVIVKEVNYGPLHQVLDVVVEYWGLKDLRPIATLVEKARIEILEYHIRLKKIRD